METRSLKMVIGAEKMEPGARKWKPEDRKMGTGARE